LLTLLKSVLTKVSTVIGLPSKIAPQGVIVKPTVTSSEPATRSLLKLPHTVWTWRATNGGIQRLAEFNTGEEKKLQRNSKTHRADEDLL